MLQTVTVDASNMRLEQVAKKVIEALRKGDEAIVVNVPVSEDEETHGLSYSLAVDEFAGNMQVETAYCGENGTDLRFSPAAP